MATPTRPAKPAPAPRRSLLATLWVLLTAAWATCVDSVRVFLHDAGTPFRRLPGQASFRDDVDAFTGWQKIIVIVVGLVLAFFLPLALIPVAAALLPDYFSGLGTIATTIRNATFGDPLVDPLMPILSSVLLFIGVFGILSVLTIVVAVRYARSNAS